MIARQHDRLRVQIFDTNDEVGVAAGSDLTTILQNTITEKGSAAIILATGNSQLSLMKSLREDAMIAWDKITIFHMDEYLGMAGDHPASLRRYLHENLVDAVLPKAFHELRGEAADSEAEMLRYVGLLAAAQPIACVMGIGENGHLAFNDPPADFETEEAIQIVTLTESGRQQQVSEGFFASLDDVPEQAITLTIPALLNPPHILVVVPEQRKAQAVKDVLEGPVTPDCPASILRTVPQATLYLDRDAAYLLKEAPQP